MNPALDFPVLRPSRLPAWALGLSLVAHLAVLAWPHWQRQMAETPLPPLVVSLRQPASSAPAPATSAPPPVARLVPAPPTPIFHTPASAIERKLVPRPAPVPAAVAGPAPAAAVASTSAEAVSPPATERSETAPVVRLAANPAAEADAAAMARYIRLLGDLLAQQQQYPRLAAMRGWEGEVRLRLQVARKGTIIAVQVTHSSGFDVLDQHAVNLVHSTTLPPPPTAPAAGGSSPDFLIDIPIHYSLRRS